jgi:hypothetical protein
MQPQPTLVDILRKFQVHLHQLTPTPLLNCRSILGGAQLWRHADKRWLREALRAALSIEEG